MQSTSSYTSAPRYAIIFAATVNLLQYAGSVIESEASELSLAAITIKVAGQQQQQQQLRTASPEPPTEAPTARQLFLEGSTPARLEVGGSSQTQDLSPAVQQPVQQRTVELLAPSSDQQQQQQLSVIQARQSSIGGARAEDSFDKLLANLKDVHDRLAAERQQQQQIGGQAHGSQANKGLLQQQQHVTAPSTAGTQHSQVLLLQAGPASAGVSNQQFPELSLAVVDASPVHQITSTALAAAAAPAASDWHVAIDTENSFNQLLVGLRDVHDGLAAERQHQQQRMKQQQQDQATEDSFDGLLLSLRDVHDQLAALRRPQQPAAASADSLSDVLPAAADHVGGLQASTTGSSSTSHASSDRTTPYNSEVLPLVDMVATMQDAPAVAAATGVDPDLRPSMVVQAAAARRALSPLAGSAAAVGSSSIRIPSLAKHMSADERFSVLRHKLQESRAALQAISMPASAGVSLVTAADATPTPAAAGRDASPLALPASGWLKATPLQQYLTRSRLQQGKPAAALAAAAAANNQSSRHHGSSHIQSLIHKWRTEASTKSQAAPTPVAAAVVQRQQLGPPDMAGLGLSPLSPLNVVSRVGAMGVVGAATGSSSKTPVASIAAAHTPLPAATAALGQSTSQLAVRGLAEIPGNGAAGVAAAATPMGLLFPMSPLLSSSIGASAGFPGSTAGTAAAARAAGTSSALTAAAAIARGVGSGADQGSRLTTPNSQVGSAHSQSNSPPSVNMLQEWVRHGSPTKRIKQQLRSRAWQEQQQQQQMQQQKQLDDQVNLAQVAMQDLNRSRSALQAAAQRGVGSNTSAHSILQQHRLQGSDTTVVIVDQTAGTVLSWPGNDIIASNTGGQRVGKSPAAVLAATAAVAEDAAAALAVAAVTSGSARHISPTSRLKELRMQQAVAASNQQQKLGDVQQQMYQQERNATPSAAVPAASVVTRRYNPLQNATPSSSRTDTWLQTAALKRQQQSTTARLETAAAGLADVRRQLAATGVARASSSKLLKGPQGLLPGHTGLQGRV